MLWVMLSLLSAFFKGSRDILVKKLFKNEEIDKNKIIFAEYLVLFFILICLNFTYEKIEFYYLIDFWQLMLLKAFSLLSYSFLFLSLLKKYEISVVTPLTNLSPLVLLVFSFIFLNEIITLLQFLGIIIILISIYFLEVTLKHHKENNPIKSHLNFFKKIDLSFIIKTSLMLISISVAAIVDRILLKTVTVQTNLFYTAFFILIALIVYHVYNGDFFETMSEIIKKPQLILISVIANFGTFTILFAISIPTAKLSLIIPIKRTSTLFSALIGGSLFHEKHLKKKILVIILMLFGVLLLVV